MSGLARAALGVALISATLLLGGSAEAKAVGSVRIAIAGSSTPPTLTILSPTSGETVRAPFPVRYRVTGFRVGPPPYGHMHAFVGDPNRSVLIELPLTRQAGVVLFPDNKRLSGRRNLTFQLATANHKLLRNPEARFTVFNLVIEGRR